ncbi:MAG: hypothetical protein M4579_005203 [Chaenotheca gracillima]|nr:MAG: hypothetical protein M4579_005203 [Chaenotheca gracillima]
MATDLAKLAAALLQSGPHKQEVTTRRVRALFNRVYVADTTSARFVWEHPYYPQFYVPVSSVKGGELRKDQAIDDDKSAFLATLKVGSRATNRVLLFEKGALAGLVRIEFGAVDSWYEEDQEIYVHPKDPYKRVDVLPSSRKVTVKVDGQTIAESSNVMCLYETGLPTRHYLPQTAVDWNLLTPSDVITKCPYKGEANYFDVEVKGKKHRGLVWWYRYPTPESIAIAGRVCAYDEKVDTYIDDVLQERPKSKFG